MAVSFDPTKEVPSLELCKRLRKLGYPQRGNGWCWVYLDSGYWILALKICGIWVSLKRDVAVWDGSIVEKIKAPTVRELGEWLPVNIKEGKSFLNIDKPSPNTWIVGYTESRSWRINAVAYDSDTEANARAKMIIWLAENGYVKFKGVKQ